MAAIIPGMLTLAHAATHIPISTAYAVWAGLGAAFMVTWAMLSGAEPATLVKILLLIGIVGSVVGLKLLKPSTRATSAPEARRPDVVGSR